ncbi:SH3 domain-containing protein [Hyphomonas sp.]|uniref:SH3 domain-containing protein n=1 Tax=Hyphomonas sp. TaxID=87 RepID=UPI00391C2456
MKRAILSLALLLGAAASAFAEPASLTEPVVSRFSGKPVPRFETLRWAEVNGRTGPSLAYPVAWRYNRKGLPVLILKESGEWRHVRDPSGDEVWIHQRMLEGGASALVTRTVILANSPAVDASPVAEVGEGVLVQVDSCQLEHCRIRAGNFRGFAPRDALWGASLPEIRTAATNG